MSFWTVYRLGGPTEPQIIQGRVEIALREGQFGVKMGQTIVTITNGENAVRYRPFRRRGLLPNYFGISC